MNWMDKIFRSGPVLLAVIMSGCTMSQVSLDYQPALAQVVSGKPVLNVGRFTNSRGETSKYLGVVRTPIGTPLEYIYTRMPVEEIVRNAFSHACSARGMLTSTTNAQFIITGEVLEMSCQQLVHPYAYVRIRMNVVRASNGQMVFTRVYAGERQNAAYRPGSGSPVPALRELASRALQDAVDRALDDPEFRGRIRGGGSYQPGML
jgi:hypothetical protein